MFLRTATRTKGKKPWSIIEVEKTSKDMEPCSEITAHVAGSWYTLPRGFTVLQKRWWGDANTLFCSNWQLTETCHFNKRNRRDHRSRSVQKDQVQHILVSVRVECWSVHRMNCRVEKRVLIKWLQWRPSRIFRPIEIDLHCMLNEANYPSPLLYTNVFRKAPCNLAMVKGSHQDLTFCRRQAKLPAHLTVP